ncbi:uncharacterized protein C19orf84 homolog [Gracilinanus agilis]|uniref:uncharacterized protein C19orf84 homolog n=1 Tax=Gracilinanus agilis TaxID=191870 RepID=UPI001CFDB6F7|nr:uncharacterized protein C19orf84 homolog [Gracilinanus agilis]
MENCQEKAESGGSGISEPQKSPASIPVPQTMALSQMAPGPVMALGPALPQLPEGPAAVTIPIRLDALSYLLHSALLGAYSLRSAPALCPYHPNPCCGRPQDQPLAQEPPQQPWARSWSQRDALWPGEGGPKGRRGPESPVGPAKQSWRGRPSPLRPTRDQGSECQRRRSRTPLPQPREDRDSKYQPRGTSAPFASLPEEWEQEYQPCRPLALPPQPREDCENKYLRPRAPAATPTTPSDEDWETDYQESESPAPPGPQEAPLVCSDPRREKSPEAQALQPPGDAASPASGQP